jgi:hypothetical protein
MRHMPAAKPQSHGEIYSALKTLLKKHAKPFAVEPYPGKKGIMLYSKDEVMALGKKQRMCFAGLMEHKSHVGFYFMPMYTDPSLKKKIAPEFAKLLKGKSCFHIRKVSPELLKQADEALKLGFDAYKKNGWV